MKVFSIIVLILFSGCSGDFYKTQLDQNHVESKKRICTVEQLKMVNAEYDLCSRTGYFTSHCYDISINKYCSKVVK